MRLLLAGGPGHLRVGLSLPSPLFSFFLFEFRVDDPTDIPL